MARSRKNAPEEVMAQECIGTRLRMIDRAVTAIYEEELRSAGLELTIGQLTLLTLIAQQEQMRAKSTCQSLQLDPSTLSRNLRRMQDNERQWIEESADENDARAKIVRITPQGRAQLAQALPAWQKAQKRVEALLGIEGVAWLCKFARALCEETR